MCGNIGVQKANHWFKVLKGALSLEPSLMGFHRARVHWLRSVALSLRLFFFLKMDQLSLTPSPLKLGETILVVISKLWHLITTCMSSPM